MEIPGIGEKMVDKIYQGRESLFTRGGTEAAAATGEAAASEETPVEEGGSGSRGSGGGRIPRRWESGGRSFRGKTNTDPEAAAEAAAEAAPASGESDAEAAKEAKS